LRTCSADFVEHRQEVAMASDLLRVPALTHQLQRHFGACCSVRGCASPSCFCKAQDSSTLHVCTCGEARLTVGGLSPGQALGTSCFWHAEWRMSKRRRSRHAKACGCVARISCVDCLAAIASEKSRSRNGWVADRATLGCYG
jgi:hypothetical protein